MANSTNEQSAEQQRRIEIPWVDILQDAEAGLLALSVRTGLKVLQQMMAAEVDEVAGPKGQHNPARQAVRHGTEAGSVMLGDRKIPVTHPRVRTADGQTEIPLTTYHAFQDASLATQAIMERMLYGVATRQQAHADAAFEAAAPAAGPSKSTVSRRLIQATQQALDRFLQRRLTDRTWVVVMIDGIRVADHLVVGALGIDADGHKQMLGLVEGATENSRVVTSLLTDLRDRGVTADQGLLVVMDGAKALAKAVHDVWGSAALIQRCQVHKILSVVEHLPKSTEDRVRRQIRKAYREPDADKAQGALEALARDLDRDHPGAANSLREGLAETLTVHHLGLPGILRQTLANTNALESVHSQFRQHAQQVKHWNNGQQVLRWLASASFFVEDTFTRIPGYRDLPVLQQALQAMSSTPTDARAKKTG